MLSSIADVTPQVARELAAAEGVCVRPLLRRVLDRETGIDQTVPIACGSTREAVCPPCAHKARVLRMQQCAEGWHRDQEPELGIGGPESGQAADADPDRQTDTNRRVRSTRRRNDVADLPRKPAEDRTVGQVFTAPDGKQYRPSMFLTLTLPSYGTVSDGVPVDPESYDYRRAALDALHFPRLVDRFWQNLRRCAGYRVQYFAAVEPQHRLAPHLHAAIRGAIPRETLRRVIRATYLQLWWPSFDDDHVVYSGGNLPRWTGEAYCDPTTGEMLPTWDEAVSVMADKPAHTMRFGVQADMAGIIAPSADADRAVRYLTKYLAKAVSDPLEDHTDEARERHIDRMHAELQYLPCSPRCANWLRYGVQPEHPGPGLRPGHCLSKAHDREHLGLGGRRVLVSRDWSGKTLAEHKADRAAVVREALLSAGIVAPEIERLAATVTASDGLPRFVWTDETPDPASYTQVILRTVSERRRWRAQYEAAKAVETVSAIPLHPPPDDQPESGLQGSLSRVESEGREHSERP
jgi:hypothetical protein